MELPFFTYPRGHRIVTPATDPSPAGNFPVSEPLFRELIGSLSHGIFTLDDRGRFTYLSPQCEAMFGFNPQELTGKTISSMVASEERDLICAMVAGALVSRSPPSDYHVSDKKGNIRTVRVCFRSHNGNDGEKMVAGVVSGIENWKTEEEVLNPDCRRALDAMVLANRKMMLLESITRHDIKNQLGALLGFIELLKAKTTDPLLLQLIEKGVERAAKNIEQQIRFTGEYKQIGVHEPFWQDLETVLGRIHFPDTVTLHADIRGTGIFADPMLEKVFFNLLDNAIRHGVRVTEIRLSSRRDSGALVLLWEDNGIGIPADMKEKIFNRAALGKNTGGGMFLSRMILEITGITIRETGEPGKGARFEIAVPPGMFRP